ncbi:MAG: hypothetical protein BYD32DRAFT_222534 [Podila humilis]|nr:MAG: hypothetical protein BYD32DRAFT_222534 [Podila humilis]
MVLEKRKGFSSSTGSIEYIVARPDLYDLLLRLIPKEHIHMGTKVVSFEQDSEQVSIQCADGSMHQGDILVAADGAYSAIRHLFKDLNTAGALPSSDNFL